MTELQELKKKWLGKNGQPHKNAPPAAIVRIKQLRDAEPLSQTDIDVANKREEEQKEKDIAAFKARQQGKSNTATDGGGAPQPADPALDKPAQREHPRIEKLKAALSIFAQLEVDPGRQNEFVLIVRGVAITAGDVRDAREAMKV